VKPAVVTTEAAEAADPGDSQGFGVVMTPFEGTPGNVYCKSQRRINEEFHFLHQRYVNAFRYHGTSCDQACKAVRAATRYNSRLTLGVFDLRNVGEETQELIRQVTQCGGFDNVHAITLGNEDVHHGMSVSETLHYVRVGTDMLRKAGFTGDLVHSEPAYVFLEHSEMCTDAAGTQLGANIFANFNRNVRAEEAGEEVERQVEEVRRCSQQHSSRPVSRAVVVTETGWATEGENNGESVPGHKQQMAAITSIAERVRVPTFFSTAFDHTWQSDFPGSLGYERHYGLFEKTNKWSGLFQRLRSYLSRS
jgi:exo-beta-1,3-glucanase (GH17 family)